MSVDGMKSRISRLYAADSTVTAATISEGDLYICTNTASEDNTNFSRLLCVNLEEPLDPTEIFIEPSETIVFISYKGSNIILSSENRLYIYSTTPDGPTRLPTETIPIRESITALAIEDEIEATFPFTVILGTANGTLLQDLVGKYSWFNKNLNIVHKGVGLNVAAISLKYDCIVWSDVSTAYVMNMVSRSIIASIPLQEYSWDNPQLYIYRRSHIIWRDINVVSNQSESAPTVTNRSVIIAWGSSVSFCPQITPPNASSRPTVFPTQCIAISLSNFDIEHVCIIGFPIFLSVNRSLLVNTNILQIVLLHCISGESIIFHTVDISGINTRPSEIFVISSYSIPSRKYDFMRWKLHSARRPRGGLRGLPPTLLVVSSNDMITLAMKDNEDMVEDLLENNKFQEAYTLVVRDPTTLRRLTVEYVVDLYMTHLEQILSTALSSEEIGKCTGEICGILKQDSRMWRRWILRFVDKGLLADYTQLPLHNPRLESNVYEGVIYHLLNQFPIALLEVARLWSKVYPPIINIQKLSEELKNRIVAFTEGMKEPEKSSIVSVYFYMETLSLLYLAKQEPEDALDWFLKIETFLAVHKPFFGENGTQNQRDLKERDVRRIFNLIEDQQLFHIVVRKIPALVRVSRELSQIFLIKNIAHFPIDEVLSQLYDDHQLLLEYLNSLVELQPALYNQLQFATIHDKHLSLFSSLISCPPENTTNILLISDAFIKFLKYSDHVSYENVIQLCFSVTPLPIQAIVYSLTKLGRLTEALSLFLREGGNASEVVCFVEENGYHLWPVVIQYSLSNIIFCSELLDCLGNNANFLLDLINEIPAAMEIPNLNLKIRNLLLAQKLNIDVKYELLKCIQEDSIGKIRTLQRLRKKGAVFSKEQRCSYCGLLLMMRPVVYLANNSFELGDEFSLVVAQSESFHQYCYYQMAESSIV